jgi:lipopolysaccharide export system permease protein
VKIINKYVLREHVGPLVFSLTALTSLLLLNYIAKRFGDLVGKGLGWGVIGEFFMLSVPFTVAMTLPMAILVSTLYAFSRLAAENEITALKASGVGMPRVLLPVLFGATGLAVFMLFFNDQVLPRANHRLSTLQQDIARKKPTFALRPQVINEVSPGKLSLKADYIDQATSWLKGVTIYDNSDPVRRRTIYADSGKMELAGDDLLLTLYSGQMQEVPKSDVTQLQRLFYDVDRVRVKGVANQLQRTDSTNTYKGEREMSICEMQREFATHELDFAVARYTLEQALVSGVRELTTGVPAAAPQPTSSMPPSTGLNESSSQAGYTLVPKGFTPRPALTVGRVYCQLLARISKTKMPPLVKTASAAELLPPQQLATQDTSRRSAAKDTARRAAQDTARRPAQDTATPRQPPKRVRMTGSAPELPVPTPTPTPIATTPPAPATTAIDTTMAGRAASAPPAPPVQIPGVPGGTAGVVPPRPASSSAIGALEIASTVDASRSRMLENRTSMNRYGVEIHKKFALSAACIVFVLIGAPIALRFPRGGVGLVIGVSLVVFAIYYIGLIAGESLADRGYLTPFWAMWAANVILTGVGLVLLARMGREGATSRGGDLSEFFDALKTNLGKVGRLVGLPAERRHRPA